MYWRVNVFFCQCLCLTIFFFEITLYVFLCVFLCVIYVASFPLCVYVSLSLYL